MRSESVYPRYPAYKDSGVEWLGQVPQHWTIDRIKRSIQSCKNGIWGDEPQGDEHDVVCVRVADFARQALTVRLIEPTIRNVPLKERAGRLLQKGDLLLEKSGGGESQPVGCVVLYDGYKGVKSAVCSNFVARMRLNRAMDSSFWRFVHAAAYNIRLTIGSINQTSGIQNLDQARYFDERCAFPPIEEQKTIATFLELETAKIDTLIEKQERLISLLNEKRQAVISHAVTKGLDPDMPMKDSGIEWLGRVPKHWETGRLANIFREIAESGVDTLPILSVSIHYGVSDKEIEEKDMDRMVARSDDRSKYKRVAPGDLVYNMMRAWQGGFGTATVDGMVSPAYVVARPRRDFLTAFVESVLRTPQAVEQMRRFSQGVTDFRLRLYWDDFKNMRIALPPLTEQVEIMAQIGREASKIDLLIARANQSIELMKEHRAALISAAVTGKIDVRQLS